MTTSDNAKSVISIMNAALLKWQRLLRANLTGEQINTI